MRPAGDQGSAKERACRLLAEAPAEAVKAARAYVLGEPKDPEGYVLLGRALARSGRSEEAIAVLSNPAAAAHERPEGWRLLGDLLSMAGDHAGADQAYLKQVRASVHDPALRNAALSLSENNLPEAEMLLREHLRSSPTDVAAIRMLAELAARIGRYPDAIKLLRRAVELAPSFTAASHNLAIVLFRNNQCAEALDVLEDLLAEDERNPAYQNLAGAVSMKVGQVERAIGHFEAALAEAEDQSKIWHSYGHALKTMGRQDEGVRAYRRALELDPLLGESWWSMANLKTFRFDAADIASMQAMLERSDLDDEGRLHTHFALGKALEDKGDYSQAFAHYAAGNAIRRKQLDYDGAAVARRVDRDRSLFTPAFFAEREGQGCLSPDPIFIVGMPRSGSTLVEQILASHSLIEGTQELPDMHSMALRLGFRNPDGGYADTLAGLSGKQLRELGEEYLDRTRIHRLTMRPVFIDKMPNNWQHVGLISLILPNAKIVDVRRNPLACCLSNFKQHFAQGQAFSYDLAELGEYYVNYTRLLAHMAEAAPGRILRVHYEDLVADTEAQVRRLLDYIGVPFERSCLDFHRNARPVRTASSEQVRRPINREGLEQWRHFDEWLGPLRDALGDVLTCYPLLPADWQPEGAP